MEFMGRPKPQAESLPFLLQKVNVKGVDFLSSNDIIAT